MSPALRLLLATYGLLVVLKTWSLARAPLRPRGLALLIFLFAWPGMRPESFAMRGPVSAPIGRPFVQGFASFVAAIVLQLVLAWHWPALPPVARSWVGLGSFLLLVHFGVSGMMVALYRLAGFSVEPLFDAPLCSRSLRDFWGRRWNIPFVDMNKRLFWPLLGGGRLPTPVVVLLVFLLSGVLHEVGVSFPAGGGWGLPFAYFAAHGLAMLAEAHLPVLDRRPLLGRLWTWVWLLAPAGFLFHAPFREVFVDVPFRAAHDVLRATPVETWLGRLLRLTGGLHLLVLVASMQVPARLGWKEELARLGRFNRKVFWTYGGYIVLCIVAFAAAGLLLGPALLDPHPAARAVNLFIGIFWTLRIVIDVFYFKHDDWPPGEHFVIGHACLCALFAVLASAHWAALAWQLAGA